MPDSSEPVDAEIVPDPVPGPTPAVSAPSVPAPSAPAPSVPATPVPAPDYDERGVPSFDHVRDKIERRWATSVGTAELVGEAPAARSLDEQEAERTKAAKAKLDEIRRSLGH